MVTQKIDEFVNPIRLGENLRLAREAKNIRQEDAAALISVARTTMIAIEQGKRSIKATELDVLSRVYGLSVEVLMTGTSLAERLIQDTSNLKWTSVSNTEYWMLVAARDGDYHKALTLLLVAMGDDR